MFDLFLEIDLLEENTSGQNLMILLFVAAVHASWEEWWTYDGISGKNLFLIMYNLFLLFL
jgi:hypothetical protein